MRPVLAAIQAAIVFLLFTLSPLWAQPQAIDYEAWQELAQRAEVAIESGEASNASLEVLRSDISAFREQLLRRQNAGDPRLDTLQSQLEALGPAPEEGDELQDISDRRAQLEAQIAEIRAPLRKAEEAYTRADGLVQEIDEIIRTRQADLLLERGPSPLDPRVWPGAFGELAGTFRQIWVGTAENWDNSVRRESFFNDWPIIALMVALALLLMFRAPIITDRLASWLRNKTRRGTNVWSTLLSLLRMLLPVLGITILVQAAEASTLLGALALQVSTLLPPLLFVVLYARWLARQTFSSDDDIRTIALPQQRRTEARYYVNGLSWLLAWSILQSFLSDIEAWSIGTTEVVQFPVHVLCGVILFRLGQILRRTGPEDTLVEEAEVHHHTFASRLARLVGQGAMVVGVAGPILSAIGYYNIAQATIFPTVMTLGLFAFLLLLQRVVYDIYHLVTGNPLDDEASLLPVLSAIVLMIVALPLLALIWGARIADLTELWARFQAGFSFGETRISPTDFLTFAIVFGIGFVMTRLVQGGLRGSVLPKTKLDQGGRTAIVSGTGYLGIFLAAIVAITSAGINLSSLAIVAGALSVGIGFGLQNIVSNFVSGIILLIERPISEGDWIEVNGQHGTVKDISVRSTRIETFDRTDVIVPNADLVSNSVTNYTRGNVLGRLVVDVGVAYGTDTRKVEDVLYKIARNHEMVLMNPPPFVHFKGFGADSLDFDVRMILRDVTKILVVRTEVNHMIAEAFAKEGIEIPFAQRDIWLRNPETLREATRSETDHSRDGSGDTQEDQET